MPLDVLGVEAFVVEGRSYMYFGPIPALFRLPVAVLTDHLDGRLTQVSRLVAFAVLLFLIVRLYWRLRQLRGEASLGRFETGVCGLYMVVAGIGGVHLFLASRAWVYHEAALWGLGPASELHCYNYSLLPRRWRTAVTDGVVPLCTAWDYGLQEGGPGPGGRG